VSGHTNNPLKGVTNGTTFGVNIIHEFDTDHLSTFVHEYSHAAFSLSDEYDCGGLMDTAYSAQCIHQRAALRQPISASERL
jgi:hypothetical protein